MQQNKISIHNPYLVEHNVQTLPPNKNKNNTIKITYKIFAEKRIHMIDMSLPEFEHGPNIHCRDRNFKYINKIW